MIEIENQEYVDLMSPDLKGKRRVENYKMIYESSGDSDFINELYGDREMINGEEKTLTPETLFLSVVFNFLDGEREEIYYREKYIVAPPNFSEDSILEATEFDGDIVTKLTEYMEVDDEEFEDFETDDDKMKWPRELGEFF